MISKKARGLGIFLGDFAIQQIDFCRKYTIRRNQGGVSMNIYLRKDGRYEQGCQMEEKLTEKGRFYTYSPALKNNVLSASKQFANKTDLKDAAI